MINSKPDAPIEPRRRVIHQHDHSQCATQGAGVHAGCEDTGLQSRHYFSLGDARHLLNLHRR